MSSTSSSWRTSLPQLQRSRSVRLTMVLPQPSAIPDRNAVAPPQLPRDAPVPDVLHPVGVFVAPMLGDESEPAVPVGSQGGLRERGHPHEPLI